jgi:hypothetical protein
VTPTGYAVARGELRAIQDLNSQGITGIIGASPPRRFDASDRVHRSEIDRDLLQ